MRTSSQLTKQHTCANSKGLDVTRRSDSLIHARVQKDVLKRTLLGEIPAEFDAIKDEILSMLDSADVHFENRYQREDTINRWSGRILRYVQWDRRDLDIPEKEDFMDADSPYMVLDEDGNYQNTDVEIYGEMTRVLPDFITRNGNAVTIGKIKTSRVSSHPEKDFETDEVYALGMLGKKLFPHCQINIEVNHLGDVSGSIERALSSYSYNLDPVEARSILRANRVSGTFKSKTNDRIFTEEMQHELEEAHAQQEVKEDIEITEDCASCPKFNVCNYVEPPIPMAVEEAVRPISEIHLTEEQQQAVDVRNGVYRINAGAGAGKTLVVAFRVKEMLKDGIDPKKILLITFTNAGASEMKARVKNYCAADGIEFNPEDLNMTTFNAFCQELINENYEILGFTKKPTVVPEELRMDYINTVISSYPKISTWTYGSVGTQFQNSRYSTNAILMARKFFTAIKENGYTRNNHPWEVLENQLDPTEEVRFYDDEFGGYINLCKNDLDILFQMYADYDQILKSSNHVEYADQMILTNKLHELRPELFEELGYEHIIVDEFQDTDLPQIELLQKMKDTHAFQSLMCVGDDSQAIFGFRHTSPEYMINFGKYLGDGSEATGYRFNDIYLLENHRSTKNIIDFANAINENSENRVEKDLIATKQPGVPVYVQGYYTTRSEYKAIAEQIKADIDGGVVPSDIAFLAHNKSELLGLASELTKLGVPSILMNPLPYLDNSNCAATQTFFDSFAYRTSQGLMDYINAKEKGSLITATSEEIQGMVEDFEAELDGNPVTRDTFVDYIKALDPEEKDPCLQDFITSKLEPCESMDELKQLFHAMKLYGKESTYKREGRYNGVALCTIHSAKGLEWQNVYYSVDNLDKSKFHSMSNNMRFAAEKEEINRLHFVAATRAKEKCVCAGKYTIKESREDVQLNNALRLACQIIDQPFGFSAEMMYIVKAQEKAELKAQTEGKKEATETPRSVPRVRQMTEEEVREYEHFAANASQMDIGDWLLQQQQDQAEVER